MVKRVLMAGVLTLCWTAAALAQPAPARLTLAAAIATAAATNPQARAALASVQAARAREVQAGALPNPNMALIVDQVPLNSPGDGNFMAGISQPLLLAGQREARREAARLDREAAELALAALRRQLTAEVREAYAQLLFERAATRLAGADREAAAALARAAGSLVKAGELAPVEALRTDVERNRAERAFAAAEARARKARGALNVLLGAAAAVPLEVAELPIPDAGGLPPLETLEADGLTNRVELRQAGLAIARETALRRVAQAGLWTGTEVSVLGGAVGGVGPGVSVTLTLPIPLYRQQGEIAEAEANQRRAEAERDGLRNRITLEIEEAYRDAVNASAQVIVYRKSYMPQAERLADNARRRFVAGEGSSVEVVEARRALTETRGQYEQTILDYRRAVAALELAIGVDLPTE